MSAKIKKDDTVVLITGAEKGKTGKVLLVQGDRVLVEGRNLRTKHMRRSQENPDGAIVQKEVAIHISNLKKADSATTTKASTQEDAAEVEKTETTETED